MKRMLTALSAAALLALPTVAGAAGSFVRSDGAVFDSDVGAACGALHTDVLFSPWSASLDILDEPVLDYLATCMTSGPLAYARIAVIGTGDETFLSPSGQELARDRMYAVIRYLISKGVSARQLEPWAFTLNWGAGEPTPDRVMFRILEGSPQQLSF